MAASIMCFGSQGEGIESENHLFLFVECRKDSPNFILEIFRNGKKIDGPRKCEAVWVSVNSRSGEESCFYYESILVKEPGFYAARVRADGYYDDKGYTIRKREGLKK